MKNRAGCGISFRSSCLCTKSLPFFSCAKCNEFRIAEYMLEGKKLWIFKFAFSILSEHLLNILLDSLTFPKIIYWHQFQQNTKKKNDFCFSITIRGQRKEKEIVLKSLFLGHTACLAYEDSWESSHFVWTDVFVKVLFLLPPLLFFCSVQSWKQTDRCSLGPACETCNVRSANRL